MPRKRGTEVNLGALVVHGRLAIGARDAGNEEWNDPKNNHPTGGFL